MTIDHDKVPAPPRADTAPLRRIVLAAFAGTTIEFYDFFIYGTAAALVFGTVFLCPCWGCSGCCASRRCRRPGTAAG